MSSAFKIFIFCINHIHNILLSEMLVIMSLSKFHINHHYTIASCFEISYQLPLYIRKLYIYCILCIFYEIYHYFTIFQPYGKVARLVQESPRYSNLNLLAVYVLSHLFYHPLSLCVLFYLSIYTYTYIIFLLELFEHKLDIVLHFTPKYFSVLSLRVSLFF